MTLSIRIANPFNALFALAIPAQARLQPLCLHYSRCACTTAAWPQPRPWLRWWLSSRAV